MAPRDPEDLPEGGALRSAGGLFEGFVRDALINGAVLVSLIVVVAGFVTKSPGWIVVTLVVGGAGMVLPWLAVGRHWAISTTWVVVTGVYVADGAVFALIVLTG